MEAPGRGGVPPPGDVCRALARRVGETPTLRLTLGELERPAGLRLAVLLALDHARVAGEETALLEDATELRLVVGERLGQAMAERPGLAGKSAAGDGRAHVVLAVPIGGDDRLLDHHLEDGPSEILGEILAVDKDAAATAGEPDAGDRILALAGGIGAAQRIELLHMDRLDGSLRRGEVLEGLEIGH